MTIARSLAFALALCGAAAFVAPVADAQRRPGQSPASLAYVAKAGAGDLYEIQSSQIAARRARNPQVRSFARMLVTDHTRTTRQVLAAARASGLRPRPAVLEPAQRRMILELQRTPAGRFDQVYLSQQIPAHQEALALHQRYAGNGDAPALRRVAAGAVPVVEAHLGHARRLQR
jgi:putative membrane protein